jgi:WXG100 family type VII secretion target
MTRDTTSGISVTPQWLREISAQMNGGASDVEAILARLASDVAPVRTEWIGAAQAQFNFLWDHLQRDASGLRSALTGIAQLTQTAAAAYEMTEETIAKSFDHFRIERDLEHAITGVFDEARQRDDLAGALGLTEGPFDLEAVESDASSAAAVADTVVTGTDVPDTSVTETRVADTAVKKTKGTDTKATEPAVTATGATAADVTEAAVTETAVTEAGDDLTEEVASSEGRTKGTFRPPWARFTAKAVPETETATATGGSRVRERRFKTSDPNLRPGTRLCRLCFTVVVIEPEYIEKTDMHVFLHCPHCERSFPIRHSDV